MEEELKSPFHGPSSVTIRRNPPRRAKTTPATATATAVVNSRCKQVSKFPIQEMLDCQLPLPSKSSENTETLRVYLRIRPITVTSNNNTTGTMKPSSRKKGGCLATKKKKNEMFENCLLVNDSQSVTLSPPLSMQDSKRLKSEVYDGFTHVFDCGSSQNEVYEKIMEPLVSDFLRGKSGMLATMGPTGSGKTHTIFGSPRHPGMLSLALANIFHCTPCSYYISMFEIYSEGGKGEKILDLSSSDGQDLVLQQSNVKGLQEVMVFSVTAAEAVIARGMLKRATAITNSNCQSSRSQCIINIRCAPEVIDGEVEVLPNNAVLTIVDLAGAEREKKTGNQGTRLLESNFINKTSMVFGLCLRVCSLSLCAVLCNSLLEHQKNPKKPIQKHFQNSLLTKYLRDYLEGKKRMALILTLKSGGDDYLDASFLLRQASPYMKIKFDVVEEPYHKRNISKLPREEKSKRRKLSDVNVSKIDEDTSTKDEYPLLGTELISVPLQQLELLNGSISSSRSIKVETNQNVQREECCIELERTKRKEQVMQNFSKALWNVLKEYKRKLEDSRNEVQFLKRSLEEKNAQSVELETEIEDLKSCSLHLNQQSAEASSVIQAECIGVAVDSNLSFEDLEENASQSSGSSAVHGRVVKDKKDIEHEEVKEELLSTDKAERGLWCSDLFVSSSTEQSLVGDGSCLTMSHSTHLSQMEPALPGSRISAKESEFVDTCNANKSDSDLGSSCKLVETPRSDRRRKIALPSILVTDINELDSKIDRVSLKPLPGLKVSPNEEIRSTDSCIPSKRDSKRSSSCKSLNVDKAGRKLLPASSTLLKEMTTLDSEVDIERPEASQDSKVSTIGKIESLDTCNARKIHIENRSPCKSSNLVKPRRRLLPASSMLLREINDLDLDVENERPTGSRGGRKLAAEEIGRTQGSICLLKLLKNNLHP
ncbi:hypothetical protein IFM89_001146 [Coptis chinensis]|uniref:Kinesin motor domain-containing protein n=1 Tax=Coptis chinensis TaxID=261450 RepID=A0A835IKW0_9MAGN|nr:hypothetical protein IFM89_001146 [Coptis chinensis]